MHRAMRRPSRRISIELFKGSKMHENSEKSAQPKPDPPECYSRDRNELFERLRALRSRLPSDFKFDRDEANGR